MSSTEATLWVVDASVIFGWFATCRHSDQAVALLQRTQTSQRIAPDLALIELLNAGWKTQRRGAITEDQLQAMASLTPQLLGEVVPSNRNLLQGALSWCKRLDHPAYDCLYLALAQQRNATLVTADQRLLNTLSERQPGATIAIDLAAWPAPVTLSESP